jgi:hypothetical protein
MNSNSVWEKILKLGRLAPTPHNTQWYFIKPLDEQRALVGIDSNIRIPFTDPEDQFKFTGLGVFVRHLHYAAVASGFDLEYTLQLDNDQYPVALKVRENGRSDKKIEKLLIDRQTSRLPYQQTPISEEASTAISLVEGGKNFVVISSDEHIVRAVIALNNDVLFEDLKKKSISNELSRWIRYSKKSQRQHRDGFTPKTLGVAGWRVWLLFQLRSISTMSYIRTILSKQYFAQNQAASVGWIQGPLKTKKEQFDAGAYMMDVWLKCTEYGYYIQPYGSIITNNHARMNLLMKISIQETEETMVWLAFRVGISTKPARSPRKNVEEFIR